MSSPCALLYLFVHTYYYTLCLRVKINTSADVYLHLVGETADMIKNKYLYLLVSTMLVWHVHNWLAQCEDRIVHTYICIQIFIRKCRFLDRNGILKYWIKIHSIQIVNFESYVSYKYTYLSTTLNNFNGFRFLCCMTS